MNYNKMQSAASDLYDYFNNGKKGKEGTNLKQIREEEANKKDGKPPWKSTGVSNVPNYNKPSKYSANPNIKAKIYTGRTKKEGDGNKASEDERKL
jgi:hypothetical protein